MIRERSLSTPAGVSTSLKRRRYFNTLSICPLRTARYLCWKGPYYTLQSPGEKVVDFYLGTREISILQFDTYKNAVPVAISIANSNATPYRAQVSADGVTGAKSVARYLNKASPLRGHLLVIDTLNSEAINHPKWRAELKSVRNSNAE